MQPGLPIIILAREPQVILNRLYLNVGLAEALVLGRPDNCPVHRRDLLRGPQMVIVIKVILPVLFYEQRGSGQVLPGLYP